MVRSIWYFVLSFQVILQFMLHQHTDNNRSASRTDNLTVNQHTDSSPPIHHPDKHNILPRLQECTIIQLIHQSNKLKHAYIILTPFYTVKLEFTGVYIIFLIFAQKHRLWVFVRTASTHNRRFEQKYEKYRSFYLKMFLAFGGEIFYIFELACFRNERKKIKINK